MAASSPRGGSLGGFEGFLDGECGFLREKLTSGEIPTPAQLGDFLRSLTAKSGPLVRAFPSSRLADGGSCSRRHSSVALLFVAPLSSCLLVPRVLRVPLELLAGMCAMGGSHGGGVLCAYMERGCRSR